MTASKLEATRPALWELRFGARPWADGSTEFRVWAPRVESLEVKVLCDGPRTYALEPAGGGVFEARVPGVAAGADYVYVVNGGERPDPVSRWQPAGVHGPSRVVAPGSFAWTDGGWKGIPLKDFVVYELHAGTFTPEGTFEAIIPKLAYLKNLGVTAVELMPVAEFPGARNWGYDGAHLYAPQSTYGGPEGLKKLVDACHREGLAFVLDVVYNHLGPEGNYAGEFMPLYSEAHRSPWGEGLNFDGEGSEGVRRYFVENALYWLTEYHVDALRLDAVHAIVDTSERHFLEQLAEEFHAQARALGRPAFLIAESDLNDVRVLNPAAEGGYGIDTQWSDDFHHSLHAVVTKADRGYFADFGRVEDLAKAISEGFVYCGQHSVFRGHCHGTRSAEQPGEQFVVCIQNHDQIANGYWGDRLARLVRPAQHRVMAVLLLAGAPNVPMLFMGEEWAERAPFLYFTSHTDPELGRAVRKGREEEYQSFVREEGETESTIGGFSDPQSEITFVRSKLDWESLEKSPHAEMLAFYRDLLALRRRHAPLSNCDKTRTRVRFDETRRWLTVERGDASGARAILLCNLSSEAQPVPSTDGAWRLELWSDDPRYGGDASLSSPPERVGGEQAIELAGWSAALYVSESPSE
ncbi:MAG TPA: malto-oligosyltrehalose trehalohydrolase [Pyrinomonadaceae bacterium]|nr:malto-oligosyltrehalose trehalohydrolase [Pyrinomonadaceae bacterium]